MSFEQPSWYQEGEQEDLKRPPANNGGGSRDHNSGNGGGNGNKSKSKKTNRFFVPVPREKGGDGKLIPIKKEMIIVDEKEFVIVEHEYKIDGKWHNWETCPRSFDSEKKCPLCEVMYQKNMGWKNDRNPNLNTYKTAFWTVIDPVSFTINEKTYEYAVRLFPIKKEDLYNEFKEHRKQAKMILGENPGNMLRGRKYEMTRDAKTCVAVGKSPHLVEMISEEKMQELYPNAKPIDYVEVLKPSDEATLQAIADKLSGKVSVAPEPRQEHGDKHTTENGFQTQSGYSTSGKQLDQKHEEYIPVTPFEKEALNFGADDEICF